MTDAELLSYTLPVRAMLFVRREHAEQKRKYTNAPYIEHLAEVAGIVATVANRWALGVSNKMIAAAWLHDCIEDQDIHHGYLVTLFGDQVAQTVLMLSDLEKGNRAERKRLARERLAACNGCTQTIKVADLISNTASIVAHDPMFAVTYLAEARALLDVLTKAEDDLRDIAYAQIAEAEAALKVTA